MQGASLRSWLLLALVLAVASGCDDQRVEHYRVKNLQRAGAGGQAPSGADEPRTILAAIIAHEKDIWVFKLTGPTRQVDRHRTGMTGFLATVHFDGKQPIAWTLPDDWRQLPASPMRHAVFQMADELEMTLHRLDNQGQAGSVLANVNRWRRQLGLGPVDQAQLPALMRPVKLQDGQATLITLHGDVSGPDSAAGPVLAGQAAGGQHALPLRFDAPPGWRVAPKPATMSVATFSVGTQTQMAKVTVVPLPGDAGGLVANVNRWRRQVGLDPTSPQQIEQEAEQIDCGGRIGRYVDLAADQDRARQPGRILAVMVRHGPATWFVKMTGPAELVGHEKPAFEAFVGSLDFTRP